MDFFHKFATNETIKGGENGPHAMVSALRWILSGPIATNADEGVVILDSMGIQEPSDEVHGTNSFLKGSIHCDGSRYVVELPWINNVKMLPDNFELASTRLQQTERAMLKNPDVATAYRQSLKDYLDNNIIEEIDKDKGKEGNIWYLPHRMVVREDNSTTKFRIVFDGSAKYKGISLNEYLDAGPALQSDMVGVLLRFRLYSIAVQADIMKMFLQIGLKEKDRDVTRFLWKDLSKHKLHVYRFNRVCFGLTCLPFLAMAVIRHHPELTKEVHPEAARIVENNIYIDDVLLSMENQEAARRMIKELNNLMESGGFKLAKWASNGNSVLSDIAVEKRATTDNREILRTLGLHWNRERDKFTFVALNTENEKNLRAKILFQKLWQAGIDWDEPFTCSIAKDRCKWKREAKNLWEIKIPHCLILPPVEETNSIELHVYGDASKWAYGATITLPRLELMTALIAAKLVGFIKNSLAIRIKRVICWTDSQIVFSWIRSEAKNWKPSLRNRNPAILLVAELASKLNYCRLWWEGPPSLLNHGPCENTSEEHTQYPDALEERYLQQTGKSDGMVPPVCKKLSTCIEAKARTERELILIEELNEAELYWMIAVQNETFGDEKSLLMKGKLSENSRLIHLTPFTDEFGVIRVGGRLQQSNLLYQHKHPVILPNKHNITDLIIQGEHKHQWHAGVEQTLAALRKILDTERESGVKSVLRRCVVCRKENARCLNQIMAPLPMNRLVETHAFDNVRIDFAGLLYVKEGRTISKIYICLFTCMATRAIHLEPTSDMTAQSFLAAFRRFISRRGKPSVVHTDNFRTFKLAEKYIQDLFRGDEKQKIQRR
ncbi:hypothetical protein T08_13041 [Trichinella sp. T8]|nr:hypothetical protein T08_13041 [Trichinella sp. T8]